MSDDDTGVRPFWNACPPPRYCGVCEGAGRIVTYDQVARPPWDYIDRPCEVITCPECNGSGYQSSPARTLTGGET